MALTFSSLLSRDLLTSWMPLARRESAFEVWIILLRALSKGTISIYMVVMANDKILILY